MSTRQRTAKVNAKGQHIGYMGGRTWRNFGKLPHSAQWAAAWVSGLSFHLAEEVVLNHRGENNAYHQAR